MILSRSFTCMSGSWIAVLLATVSSGTPIK